MFSSRPGPSSTLSGAPVVTTAVGAEGIPDAASVMKIADKAEDFAAAVNALYDDTAALAAMGEEAVRYIREHNSMEAAWKVVEEDFS